MYSEAFKQIPTLKTERLTLRNFELSDIDKYIQEFSNPNLQRYLGGIPILRNDMKHINNWLTNINHKLLKRKVVFTWLITLNENSQRSVGRIDLGGFENKKAAELSYYIWESYWGLGYASEAIRKVLEFGFDTVDLLRIQAIVHEDNVNSKKVLLKSGFQKEGVLRNYPLGKNINNVEIYSSIA